MEYRIFGSVLVVLFFVLFGQTAMATPILVDATGTAACPGTLITCDVTLSGLSGTQALSDSDQLVLTVTLDSLQHLELFDNSGSEIINLHSNSTILSNTLGVPNNIAVDFDFLDMDGLVLASISSTIIMGGGDTCTGCGMSGFSFPSSVLFHGFIITLTPNSSGMSINLGNLQTIQFQSFGADSNVGVWEVPEPGTLAIFGMGLLGLAAMRRRKVV